MNPENERDPLLELLSGIQLPPVDPKHRDAVFSKTQGILRQRRFAGRIFKLATWAGCWLFGAFSVLAWQSIQRHEDIVARPGNDSIEIKTQAPNETQTTPADPATNPRETIRGTDFAPTEITGSESNDSLSTFEKMRRAGDRQLNELGNLRGALGCYRRALNFASDDDLKIVPEKDTWLLIPLKEARLETRKNAHK